MISIAPPAISALDLNLVPKAEPILTPAAEITNVQTPMKSTAATILTSRNAKVMPIASASILVATASSDIDFGG